MVLSLQLNLQRNDLNCCWSQHVCVCEGEGVCECVCVCEGVCVHMVEEISCDRDSLLQQNITLYGALRVSHTNLQEDN